VVVLAAGAVVYFRWIHKGNRETPIEVAYVISPSLDLLDTPAVVHRTLEVMKYGDRVDVLRKAGSWAKVRTSDGAEGWVITKELLPSAIYEAGQKLLASLAEEQVQASGHAELAVNIHLEPRRDAPELGLLTEGQPLEVFDRRIVERSTASSGVKPASSSPPAADAWYLVRAGSRAGWVLGRMVSLDPPQALSQYTVDYNTVAWLVLNTVKDGNNNVPQYLVADREGTVDFDFTHIRVFTWWVKRHRYVTSFVKSGLQGHFPITVQHVNNVPYFRLRLVDEKGRKFQAVYGLFDTIVRPIGTVDGWESTAMPAKTSRKRD
jgi:hypothetical protein